MVRGIAAVGAFLFSAACAFADEGRQVTATALNVRSGPGTSYSIIAVAGNAQTYVAFESSGAWYHIWWDAGDGWVYGAYTSSASGTAAKVTASSLHVRTGPSTSDTIVATVSAGDVYYEIGASGSWKEIWFGGHPRWFYGPYTTDEDLSTGSGAPPPPPPPPSGGSDWTSYYVGLDLSGSHIPRAGLYNGTLAATLGVSYEPYGSVVTYSGHHFVKGKVSWFGGPDDSAGTMALTGIDSTWYNNPMDPSASYLAANPEKYYYCAMRWDYSPNGTSWWKNQRILVINPANGKAVVVAPVDWGPNTSTGRILDLSHQAITDLGLDTDGAAIVSFVDAGTSLGVK